MIKETTLYEGFEKKMIKDYCVACDKKIITKDPQKHYENFGNYCCACSGLAEKISKTKAQLRTQLKKKVPNKKKTASITKKLQKLIGRAKYYTELNLEKLL